jgi:hypothetical protein
VTPTAEHCYTVFGLTLALPYARPVMQPAPAGAPAEARVLAGRVPRSLPQACAGLDVPAALARVEAGPQGEVLWIRPAARYLVTGGEAITVEVEPGRALASGHLFMQQYCLPALLIQRGLLALHANALAGPRGAIVLMGASGAGKSTLHAELMRRGLPMLSDDVTALRLGPDGRPWVLPGVRQYRLCAETLERLAPVAEALHPLAGDPRQKVLARAPRAAFQAEPAPLDAIYLLEPHDGPELSLQPTYGAEKFRRLANGSYPPLSLTFQPEHMAVVLRLMQGVRMIVVRRPRRRWTAAELADAVV